MQRTLLIVGIVFASGSLVGCLPPAAPLSSSPPTAAPSVAETAAPTPEPSESATEESAICEFFGSTRQLVVAAVSAALYGENEAEPTRDAIQAILELAGRIGTGAESQDLTTLANAMDAAALSGEGYVGWSAAYEAFFAKYAAACGEPVAS